MTSHVRRTDAAFYDDSPQSYTHFKKRYKMGKKLGTGSFATVKYAKDLQDKSEWAIRILNRKTMPQEEYDAFLKEIEILRKMDHDHICWTRQIYNTKNNVFVVVELLTGGDMFDHLCDNEKYTEKIAARCLVDITSALQYLHDNKIAHRDLKPENVMFATRHDHASIKLVDFGFSKIASGEDVMMTSCGTLLYVAPEVISSKRRGYTTKCDMWSLGVMLYVMLCGYPPFEDESTSMLHRKIKTADYDFHDDEWHHISQAAKDMVRSLICLDVSTRLSAEQVLKHKWIENTLGARNSTHEYKDLKKIQDKMKIYNARRKLRMMHLLKKKDPAESPKDEVDPKVQPASEANPPKSSSCTIL